MRDVAVGEIAHLVNGKAFKPSDWSASGVPIIRIQNLNDRAKPFNYWAGPTTRQIKVASGDVLLAWSGTPGTSFGVHIWDREPGILNQHIFRVDLDTRSIGAGWFRRAVNAKLPELIARAHGGVGLQHVTRPMVEALRIPLPELEEQRRITAILDSADALRSKRMRTLTMLADAEKLSFRNSYRELDDAVSVPLRELCLPVRNWNPAKSPSEVFHYIDISAVDVTRKRLSNSSVLRGQDAPSRARQLVAAGDIIVSTVRPNLNSVSIVPRALEGATASTGFCILRPDLRKTTSRFLFDVVRSDDFIMAMTRLATGASYPAISDRIIKSYSTRQVGDNWLTMHQGISERFTTLIDRAFDQLVVLESLFASLQHRAFSGQL